MTEETKPIDPMFVPKPKPVFLHKEDIDRVLMDKLPGHIPDFSRGGQWPGCRIIEFKHFGVIEGLPADVLAYVYEKTPNRDKMGMTDMMNRFFELFANYYLASWVANESGIKVMYSSILDDEDSRDIQEISDEIRKEMNKKRAERNAAREEAENKAKIEHDELLELGKKAKEHNLIAKLRENSDEIAELKRQIKMLTKRKKGDTSGVDE